MPGTTAPILLHCPTLPGAASYRIDITSVVVDEKADLRITHTEYLTPPSDYYQDKGCCYYHTLKACLPLPRGPCEWCGWVWVPSTRHCNETLLRVQVRNQGSGPPTWPEVVGLFEHPFARGYRYVLHCLLPKLAPGEAGECTLRVTGCDMPTPLASRLYVGEGATFTPIPTPSITPTPTPGPSRTPTPTRTPMPWEKCATRYAER